MAKEAKFAAERNRNLLHTLIPKDVLPRLAAHSGDSMLGTTIPHCTVMFCSLVFETDVAPPFSPEMFAFLHEVVSTLDRAVERSGMFKYQHVGAWYIVACPRAASPFNAAEQERGYPETYTQRMVELGAELKYLASLARLHDTLPVSLKVGMSCGPAAGAVMGTL
eukprot:CAMPEP_0113699540 /NCGR_PEP_ID=MMETSP0038_2-20120614/23388_1 /TAXON_ID=2898 /ORGANISM="Cryptomonas paramecium" /LENGTH=164 /DNA_ID=CAMNT_0000622957 /DNA_START=590 /DNA_END=1080 /DNA_ORIENTATION=- /assembly_acc=CAM_ASM_000170